MTDPRAIASAQPPASRRNSIAIRFDLQEAANNIVAEIDDLLDSGANAAKVERAVNAEINWLRELFDELREAAR